MIVSYIDVKYSKFCEQHVLRLTFDIAQRLWNNQKLYSEICETNHTLHGNQPTMCHANYTVTVTTQSVCPACGICVKKNDIKTNYI